jgi:hypothetical protein
VGKLKRVWKILGNGWGVLGFVEYCGRARQRAAGKCG